MPNYGTLSPAALTAGDKATLFNAESPAAPQSSLAFARTSTGAITFTIVWAAAPTDTVLIQGSNVDVDAQYQTLFTSTSKQFDYYTDTNRFTFYRAQKATYSAGGALTVIAQA